MTHVLSIIHYPVFGGPHNRNMRLAPVLSDYDIHTTVLLPNEPGNAALQLRDAGLDVIQLPLQRIRATHNPVTHWGFFRGLPQELRTIRALIQRLQIDVVQINGLANPHGALAARKTGVPVVWQILDTYTPMPLRHVIAPLLRSHADVVMCTGQRVAEAHPGATRFADRLVIFYPPVDTARFHPDPERRKAAQEKLGVADASLVVGTVGNINLQKGHDHFLSAAARVKTRVPDAKFLLLGATHKNHQAYIDGLWSLASELGLTVGHDIIALDPTGRVHELAPAMDVFWMTPRPNSEGIPTAMEEAMALGIPVVSYDVGSIGELVEHRRSGYLVPDQNPMAVADYTLEHLLDPQRRITMGQSGRHFVEQHASLAACAERHIQAYELARGNRR